MSEGIQLGKKPTLAARCPALVPPTIAALCCFFAACQAPEALPSGPTLARQIIALSEQGQKTVDLSAIADKVCVIPEGTYSTYFVNRFFPGAEIREVESEDSEGIWFLLLYFKNANSVYVKAIPQDVISWAPRESIPIGKLAHCPSDLPVLKSDGHFTLPSNLGE